MLAPPSTARSPATPPPRLPRGATLAIATHNRGKLAEFADLLRPWDLRPIAAAALGMTTAPEEDAPDFAGNAAIKARATSDATGLPALADDSGFCVASLAGAPGVFSARWAGEPPDFARAMRRVHDLADPHPDRSAAFVCALCLAWPGVAEVATATGRIDGIWVWPPRGDAGFGYDPIFAPAGEGRTFAEMRRDEKSRLSHRARALAALASACFTPPPH